MYVMLKTDLVLNLFGETIQLKATEIVKIDIELSIAYHEGTGRTFDIDKSEYEILN